MAYRIKDIPTTTTTWAADDYIALDGATNGGRKILASLALGGGIGVTDGDKGDLTISGSGTVWTIDAGVITNTKLANVATATLKGRATAGTGSPEDLTGTQATALLDVFSSTLKGLAPASGGGTTNFLRADGTWAAPAGGSLTDGDKGDITVSGSGATWTIDAGAVSNAKLANSTITLGSSTLTLGATTTNLAGLGTVAIADTTDASSTTVASLTTAGGVGIAKVLRVGDNTDVLGNIYCNNLYAHSASGLYLAGSNGGGAQAILDAGSNGAATLQANGTGKIFLKTYGTTGLGYTSVETTNDGYYPSFNFKDYAGNSHLTIVSFDSSNKSKFASTNTAQISGSQVEFATGGTIGLTVNASQQVQVKATTASTSTSTGALVVSGGVGVAGAINAGGAIAASNFSGSHSGTSSGTNTGDQDLSGLVPKTTTVNGHALSANVTVTASDVSLGSVTNDTQTKAAIVPNTIPTAGQMLVGNAGGTAYAPVSVSGDATLASTGALTVANSAITNAKLANSTLTLGNTTLTLGGTTTTVTGLGDVSQQSDTGTYHYIMSASSTAGTSPVVSFLRARGTVASATNALSGDTLGALKFNGRRPSSSNYYQSAEIRAVATEDVGVLASGGKLEFLATPTGSVTPSLIATFNSTAATINGTLSASNLSGTNTGDQTITLTGDVTGSGTGSFAATIGSGAVTNAKLANVATATFKGRTTAGTGSPEDLTGTQATALLDAFTSTLKGLAPASGGGTTNFLRADGTWAAPAGGSLSDGDKGDITVASSGTVWTIDAGVVTNAKLANSSVTIGSTAVSLGSTVTSFAGLTTLTFGTPAFSDTDLVLQGTGNTNSYYQIELINSNAGTTASTDISLHRDGATATTNYIDFGINSSGYSGSGSLNRASAGYLYANDDELVVGTAANKTFTVVTQGSDRVTITGAGVTTLSGQTNITDTTASSTSGNGALVVSGGIGVAGNVNAGGTVAGTNIGTTTAYRLVNIQYIQQGTTTYTSSAGVTRIRAKLIGAGGGGGGASGAATSVGAAGGGGSGSYAEKWFTVTPSTGYTCAVGLAGTAGANTGGTGGTGGATTLTVGATTVTTNGGLGGVGQTAGTTAAFVAGGAGGAVSTNGDLNLAGMAGMYAQRVSGTVGVSGGGAGGLYGQGGAVGLTAAAAGNNAGNYGAGGGGALSTANTNRAGGTGSNGILIIEEYAL